MDFSKCMDVEVYRKTRTPQEGHTQDFSLSSHPPFLQLEAHANDPIALLFSPLFSVVHSHTIPHHNPSSSTLLFLLSIHWDPQMASATATTLFTPNPMFSTEHHSLSPSPTIPKSFTGLCKPFHSRVPTSIPFFHCRRPKFFVRATVSVSASPSSPIAVIFFYFLFLWFVRSCQIVPENTQVLIFVAGSMVNDSQDSVFLSGSMLICVMNLLVVLGMVGRCF